MSYTRREYLMAEMEPMVGATRPIEAEARTRTFMHDSGLGLDDLIVNAVCGIPVPLYKRDVPDGVRRWADVNPDIMWHPFFWLPDEVASRLVVTNNDGTVENETVNQYLIRLAITLSISHLYEPMSGTWLDVPAIVDVDTTTPDGLARIAAWQDGADDPDLDSLFEEVAELIPSDLDSDELFRQAQEVEPGVEHQTVASVSDDLADWANQVADASSQDMEESATVLIQIAKDVLSSAPELSDGTNLATVWDDLARDVESARDRNERLDALATFTDVLLSVNTEANERADRFYREKAGSA